MSAEDIAGHKESGEWLTGELVRDTVPSINTVPCLLRNENGIRPGLIVVAVYGMGENDWAVATYVHQGYHWDKTSQEDQYTVIWPENLQVKQ